MADLEHSTMGEIIAEISKRTDAFAFGYYIHQDHPKNGCQYDIRWGGEHFQLIGLSEFMNRKIQLTIEGELGLDPDVDDNTNEGNGYEL